MSFVASKQDTGMFLDLKIRELTRLTPPTVSRAIFLIDVTFTEVQLLRNPLTFTYPSPRQPKSKLQQIKCPANPEPLKFLPTLL